VYKNPIKNKDDKSTVLSKAELKTIHRVNANVPDEALLLVDTYRQRCVSKIALIN
jgi:hypothetical protein